MGPGYGSSLRQRVVHWLGRAAAQLSIKAVCGRDIWQGCCWECVGGRSIRSGCSQVQPPQMRLFSAAMLAERLALAAVVMRKWQGSAWRAREAARPHTSLHIREEQAKRVGQRRASAERRGSNLSQQVQQPAHCGNE